jgi:hypothetical protein
MRRSKTYPPKSSSLEVKEARMRGMGVSPA